MIVAMKKRISPAYHELEIYRQYLNEARAAGFNRFEYADHEETFRMEEQNGGIWAAERLLQEQTRFLRECNRARSV